MDRFYRFMPGCCLGDVIEPVDCLLVVCFVWQEVGFF